METGIYRDVQEIIADVKLQGHEAYRAGDKASQEYFGAQVRILEDVAERLRVRGLRYDEHGASGRRDGKAHASAMSDAMDDLVKHSISNATEYRNMDILVDKAKVLVQQLRAAIDEVNNLNNG